MENLLATFLVLHITGIVLLGGSTLMNFVIAKQFWRYVQNDKKMALVINSSTLTFGKITAIGGALTILTGVAMVILLHGAIASQLWFRIKMVLVLLIILNSLLFARPQNIRLKKALSSAAQQKNEFNSIKVKMEFYYAIQLMLLFSIFVLSVFRFN